MAEALAEVGATVILNGRDANTLKTAADRIRDCGLKAETSAFDVTDLRATDAATGLVSRIGRKLWSSVKTPARAETNGYCAEPLIAHDLSENRFPLFGIMG